MLDILKYTVNHSQTAPIRLRAYERLALLLERTQPEQLLVALSEQLPSMTVVEVQQLLLRTVRMEYDHNMSQQIYVSDELWAKLINARDQMAAFITAMAAQLPKGSTALDYAKVLMTAYNNNGDTPHQLALDALKEEARKLF